VIAKYVLITILALIFYSNGLAVTNEQILNQALIHSGEENVGQCKVFVQDVLGEVGIVLGQGYRNCYLQIGNEILSENSVAPGDIIQVSHDTNPEVDTTHVHTAVVLENQGNGNFEVIHSNWDPPYGEDVSINVVNPSNWANQWANWSAHFYRLGTVALKFSDSPTIYYYSNNQYWPILDEETYSMLGFTTNQCYNSPDWSYVTEVNASQRPNYNLRNWLIPSNGVVIRITDKIGPKTCSTRDVGRNAAAIYLFDGTNFRLIASEQVYLDLGYSAWDDVVEITQDLFNLHGEGATIYDASVYIAGSGGGIYEPENLIATAVSSNQINLTWDRGLNPMEWNLTYKIYRNTTNDSSSAGYVDSAANTSYSNTGLSPSTGYYYWVKAVLDTDESEFSAYSAATTQSGQPNYYTFNSSLTTDYVDPNTGDHNPEKTVFYNNDNSVYSWMMLNNVYEALNVDWYWYNPANVLAATSSLVTEDPGEGYHWGGYILYTWLNISSLTDYGQWHVDIFVDNSLVSSNYFTITTDPPIANFTADTTTGAAPLTVQFTDTTVGYVSNWSWDFGDGTYSTAQNPTHAYNSAGEYEVKLTVSNYGGSDTEIKQNFITVSEPIPTYTFNSSVITDYVSPYTGSHDPEKTVFYNKDNYVYSWVRLDNIYEALDVSWKWYGPSGFIGEWGLTTEDPGEGYYYGFILWSYQRITDTNNYGIWHIDFYVNGEMIAADYFTITADPPITDFVVHAISGSTVQFTDTSTGNVTSWQWDFGDGTSSVLQNPEHTYLSAGEYQVSFTATGYGGADVEDRTIFVSELETCFSLARILGDTPVYYESLQSAYDAANDGDTLQIRESEFDNNLLANQDKTIILNGGYNCDYSSSTCNVISGTITINSGSVSIEDCPETGLCRNLPAPQIVLRGREDYTVDEVEYTNFRLSVVNRDDYAGLFYLTLNLPPCGLNTNASRTWVEMYDNNNEYIYGFCGFYSESSLHELRFSIRKDDPIESVHVILVDRECGVSYTSNTIVLN
jgi:PKD repeat protein